MNIHEYQAKQLLALNGVPLPSGEVCDTPEAAKKIAQTLLDKGEKLLAIKAQIHSGGRGKGTFKNGFKGGVKLTTSANEIYDFAKAMLGNVLVTKQTGAEGRPVNKLLIAGAPNIKKELYCAVLLDRATSRPIIMASTEGGMDIEEVAAHHPDKIFKLTIDPAVGMMPFHGRQLAIGLGLKGDLIGMGAKFFQALYKTWSDSDATMVEINPLCIVTNAEGKDVLLAVDAKLGVDDNALYRHPNIQLEGNIACLVNGAGLAMATMDIIKHFGGDPANFLDVGGGATRQQVTAAFNIILSDPHVKGILVNIFGGIMQCDIIAAGIVDAVKETHLSLPLVVRLEGNNSQLGKQILKDSKLAIIPADSMADAAQKVVQAVKN